MKIDIRLPNITATEPAEQIVQIKNYLFQMVQELNFALSTIDTGENGKYTPIRKGDD